MTAYEVALCVLDCRSDGVPNQVDSGYLVCPRCASRVHGLLAEIVDDFSEISRPAAAVRAIGERAGGPPVFESRSPANDHVIAMRDPRTYAAEPGDLHSPLDVLWRWAAYVREQRGMDANPNPTVMSEADTLSFHWDWICRQTWVANLARYLREVRSQLHYAVTGEDRPRPVGRCTNQVADEDALADADADGPPPTKPCANPLFLPKRGRIVTCRACGYIYDGPALADLYLANKRDEETQ